jgi:hypothetical protein
VRNYRVSHSGILQRSKSIMFLIFCLNKSSRWRILLKWFLKIWIGSAWTGLVWFLDKDKGRAFVNTVMNLPSSIKCVRFVE